MGYVRSWAVSLSTSWNWVVFHRLFHPPNLWICMTPVKQILKKQHDTRLGVHISICSHLGKFSSSHPKSSDFTDDSSNEVDDLNLRVLIWVVTPNSLYRQYVYNLFYQISCGFYHSTRIYPWDLRVFFRSAKKGASLEQIYFSRRSASRTDKNGCRTYLHEGPCVVSKCPSIKT